MNFACVCGTVIYDQTDFLANKAYLIADQDWEDFADASHSRGYVDHSYARACYQCPSCVEESKDVTTSLPNLSIRAPTVAYSEKRPSNQALAASEAKLSQARCREGVNSATARRRTPLPLDEFGNGVQPLR
ncbi:hypothetical protein [Burkholderia ubonensis]|uniref:hypothetical protein n=1 Tax=Burkholderia ubonensis TaxID=101571 RepID=UPI000AB52556|nr:hypothetical protein [Burkholderia ubonensis]